MREKHLFKLTSLLIALLMGLAMVMSCSKDEDEGNGNENGNSIETNDPSNDNEGSSDGSISFQYGDIIPDRVLASPMQYGFSMDTVLVVYSYNYGSGSYSFYYEDVAWVDERGCFIVGSDKWNNTYIRFYYNQSNNIRTDNEVIVMDGKERYAMYDDGELFVAIIPDQNVEIRKVLFSDSGTTTTSHKDRSTMPPLMRSRPLRFTLTFTPTTSL